MTPPTAAAAIEDQDSESRIWLSTDVAQAIDLLRAHVGLDRPVDAYIAAGLKQATAYRRLTNPDDLTLREMEAVCRYFSVPLSVITGGKLAVMRWLIEQNDGPETDPGQPIQGSNCSPVVPLFRAREDGHPSHPVAA